MFSQDVLIFHTFGKSGELSVYHRKSADIEFSNIFDRVAYSQFHDSVNKKNEECLRKLNKPASTYTSY